MQYEDTHRLAYIRGPEGIIVGPAVEGGRGTGRGRITAIQSTFASANTDYPLLQRSTMLVASATGAAAASGGRPGAIEGPLPSAFCAARTIRLAAKPADRAARLSPQREPDVWSGGQCVWTGRGAGKRKRPAGAPRLRLRIPWTQQCATAGTSQCAETPLRYARRGARRRLPSPSQRHSARAILLAAENIHTRRATA